MREVTPEEFERDIQRAAVKDSLFALWLEDQMATRIDAPTEFERGCQEGHRRLAGLILDIARKDTNDDPEIETNIETEK